MALTTSLAGRVRNTSLPKSHSLLPLLEAIVNGLQAIDARFGDDVTDGRLTITIERSEQGEFDLGIGGVGRLAQKPIVGFMVEDNGIGFTPPNMKSFETLDSDHKADIGCRGVGRLLWLKAFDRIQVRSTYRGDDQNLCGVQFNFSIERGVEYDRDCASCSDSGSRVSLSGFKKAYQHHAPKTAAVIARAVFEHCIWYFIRPGGAADVMIVDEDDSISLLKLLDDFLYSDMEATTVEVAGQKFDMVNLCLKSSNRNLTPRLNWCAANRVVFEENITGKIPGLYGRLRDDSSAEFTYVCYLSSDYLDAHVRADRTAFDLAERSTEATLGDDISLDDIRWQVLVEVERILAGPLHAAREEGRSRVNDYVSNSAPRYRPVLARLEKLGITVDPSIKDSELELILHRKLQQLEADALVQGQQIFAESGSAAFENYDEELAKYLEKINDINKSDLAAYVSRRRVVLNLLDKFIKLNAQGKYLPENAIHSLLMPMRTESNEIGTDAANLWIIDERLAFHDYRLVDTPVLAASGEKLPLSSIVVVEIKRPMRNDASEGKDPIDQSLEYVDRIRSGGVTTAVGRPIPASPELPAFCYILADLTSTMERRCKRANLQRTQDGMGYFGFNVSSQAYIEVISFDKLVNAATERNRAFFDKLGLPSS